MAGGYREYLTKNLPAPQPQVNPAQAQRIIADAFNRMLASRVIQPGTGPVQTPVGPINAFNPSAGSMPYGDPAQVTPMPDPRPRFPAPPGIDYAGGGSGVTANDILGQRGPVVIDPKYGAVAVPVTREQAAAEIASRPRAEVPRDPFVSRLRGNMDLSAGTIRRPIVPAQPESVQPEPVKENSYVEIDQAAADMEVARDWYLADGGPESEAAFAKAQEDYDLAVQTYGNQTLPIEASNLLDWPRQKIVEEMGANAYDVASGKSDEWGAGLAAIAPANWNVPGLDWTRFNQDFQAWAEDPANWPAIRNASENGFQATGTDPRYTGGRAVWELFINGAGSGYSFLSDILNEPTILLGAGKSVGDDLVENAIRTAPDGSVDRAVAQTVVGRALSLPQNVMDKTVDAPFNFVGNQISGAIASKRRGSTLLREIPEARATEQANWGSESLSQQDRVRTLIGDQGPPDAQPGTTPTRPDAPEGPRYTRDRTKDGKLWEIKDPNGKVVAKMKWEGQVGREDSWPNRQAEKAVNDFNAPIVHKEFEEMGAVLPPKDSGLTWTSPLYDRITNRGRDMPDTIQARVALDPSLDPDGRREWMDRWTPAAKDHEAIMAKYDAENEAAARSVGSSPEQMIVQPQRKMNSPAATFEQVRFYAEDGLIPFNELFPNAPQRGREWITTPEPNRNANGIITADNDIAILIEHAVLGTRDDAIRARSILRSERRMAVQKDFGDPGKFVDGLSEMGEAINGPGWRSQNGEATRKRAMRAQQHPISEAGVADATGTQVWTPGKIKREQPDLSYIEQVAESKRRNDQTITDLATDPALDAEEVASAIKPRTELPTKEADEVIADAISDPETTSITPAKNIVEPTPEGQVRVRAAGTIRQKAVKVERKQGKSKGFRTEKGSSYTVTDRGTTVRDKAARREHGSDQGIKPESESTFYVTPEDANTLGYIQTSSPYGKSIAFVDDDHVGVRWDDGPDSGKFERSTIVSIQTQPSVNLTPVELWDGGANSHFGNRIVSVTDSTSGYTVAVGETGRPSTVPTLQQALDISDEVLAREAKGIDPTPAEVKRVVRDVTESAPSPRTPDSAIAKIDEQLKILKKEKAEGRKAGNTPESLKEEFQDEIDELNALRRDMVKSKANPPRNDVAYMQTSVLSGRVDPNVVRDINALDRKEIESLKESIKANGFDPNQPVTLSFNREGMAWVSEGNHRLIAAMEIGLEQVPVRTNRMQYDNESWMKPFPGLAEDIERDIAGPRKLWGSDSNINFAPSLLARDSPVGIVSPAMQKNIEVGERARRGILESGNAIEGPSRGSSWWLSKDDKSYVGAAHTIGEIDDKTYNTLNKMVMWENTPMRMWEAYDHALINFQDPIAAKKFIANLAIDPETAMELAAKKTARDDARGLKRIAYKALSVYDGALRFLREAIMFNWARGFSSAFADSTGNAYTMMINGETGAMRIAADPRSIGAFISSERGKALALDNLPGMDRHRILTGGDAPLHATSLVETRFETGHGELILESLGKGYHAFRMIADKDIKAIRTGMDRNFRYALYMSNFDGNVKKAQTRFRGIVSERAQKTGNDYVEWLEKLDALGNDYTPADILRTFNDERLARDLRAMITDSKTQATKRVDELLFSYKYTNADDALRRVVFFHYWMTRALPMHAKVTFKNPWLLNSYARAWDHMEREAEQNGYPPNVRGFIQMQKSQSGFYSLLNPMQVLVPFGMLMDSNDDPGTMAFLKRWGFFVNPIIEAAAAVVGRTRTVPDLTGTAAIRRAMRYTVNYLNSNGLEQFVPDGLGDPNTWQPSIVDEAQYRIIEQMNGWAQRAEVWATGANKIVDEYEGSSKNAYEYDQMNSILITELEKKYGPYETWEPDGPAPYELLDAKTAIEMGVGGNELADQTVEIMADAKFSAMAFSTWIPGGVYQRYGPRDETLAEKRDGLQSAKDQREIAIGTPESSKLDILQNEYKDIGSDQQKAFADGYKSIVSDDPIEGYDNGYVIQIGSENYTKTQLLELDDDGRKDLANAWVNQHGGTEILQDYRDKRDAFVEKHPEFGEVTDYQQIAYNYDGGLQQFRLDRAAGNPNFEKAMLDHREYLLKEVGVDPALIEVELDNWAPTIAAYKAANGIQDSLYDSDPISTGDQGTVNTLVNMGMLNGSKNEGGGSSYSGKKSTAEKLKKSLKSYEADMKLVQDLLQQYGVDPAVVTSSNPYAIQTVNSLVGDLMPKETALMKDYFDWVTLQPPGADTSPEAFAAIIDAIAQEEAA